MTNAEENELEQVIALEWMNSFKSFEHVIDQEQKELDALEKNYVSLTPEDWERIFKNYTDTLK